MIQLSVVIVRQNTTVYDSPSFVVWHRTSFCRKHKPAALTAFILKSYVSNLSARMQVSFSRTRYHECVKKRQWQDKILTRVIGLTAAFGVLGAAVAFSRVTDIGRDDWLGGARSFRQLGTKMAATLTWRKT